LQNTANNHQVTQTHNIFLRSVIRQNLPKPAAAYLAAGIFISTPSLYSATHFFKIAAKLFISRQIR